MENGLGFSFLLFIAEMVSMTYLDQPAVDGILNIYKFRTIDLTIGAGFLTEI